jgi:hypothetical protein
MINFPDRGGQETRLQIEPKTLAENAAKARV